MQNQWQDLLSSLSLTLETQKISPERGYIACLTELEYLKVTGPDRLTFLQGQMTCDFDTIKGTLLLGANCNLKGRASATFYAIDSNETTYLILPSGQAAHLKSLLDKYALFSDAELSLADSDSLLIGLMGDKALSLANHPEIGENQTITIPQATLGRIGNSELTLCLANTNLAQQWLKSAISSNDIDIANQQTWDQQQIALGISQVTAETRDLFIPQELNYDLINGISFNKGCYKGQEIIARLHYRGSYKQRTARFQCDTTTNPTPGSSIYSPASEQPCGHVVQSTRISNNQIELLISIKLKVLESEQLHLEQNDGPILHKLSIPYAITNRDETD